jgi:quinate dehydrogenase (quinone)
MQPSLIDFTKDDGQTVPAVVIGTKAGQIYVLDRATGKPLTDVEEVPVKPQHPERAVLANPAQIGGHAADRRQTLTESDMWGATPYDQLLCRIDFKGCATTACTPRRVPTNR